MMFGMTIFQDATAVRPRAARAPTRPRRRAPRAAPPVERAIAPVLIAAALAAADGDYRRLLFSKDRTRAWVLNRPRSEGLPRWLEAEARQDA